MNLEDIARLAGVSRSTVSRVVNDDPRVSDEVRARVSEIIERSHYHPNAAARSLASRRTRIVGLLIPQTVDTIFSDPWFPMLVQGCMNGCHDHDLSFMLMMEPSNEEESVARLLQRTVRSRHLDGLVISQSLVDDILVDCLARERFPHVLIGRDLLNQANFVDIDNRGAARDAVSHLLDHGRKRPAMIAGPQSMVASIDRLDGFRDAVREHGLDLDSVMVCFADYSQRAAYHQTIEVLNGPRQPDAIFAGSDTMAVGVIQAIRMLGRRMPDDVAVMGFDNIVSERSAQLGLSTIEQPAQGLGRTAIDSLVQQQNPNTAIPIQHVLPTRMILRTSCGCPPHSDDPIAIVEAKQTASPRVAHSSLVDRVSAP